MTTPGLNPSAGSSSWNDATLKAILPNLRDPKRQKDGRWRAWCPFHPDGQGQAPHDPDFYIGGEGYICHRCGAKGSLRELALHYGVASPSTNGRITSEGEAMAVLTEGRKLSQETLDFFRIQADLERRAWRYPASLSEANPPYRYKAFPGGQRAKYWSDKGIGPHLYGLETIEKFGLYEGDAIWWANGEPAVWACHEAGIPAVCGLAGEGKVPPKAAEELSRRGVKRVLLPPDLDQAGKAAIPKVVAAHSPLRVEVRRLPDYLGESADLADLWLWCRGDRDVFRKELEGLARETLPAVSTNKVPMPATFTLTPVAALLAEPPESVAWLWDKTLPSGGLSILAAKPKVGKSTLARNLALAVAQGEPFLGRETSPGPVIYLALEEKRQEIGGHFARMGAGNEPLHIHTGSAPDETLVALEGAIREKKAVLAIIDPILRLIRLKDANDYAEVTRALEPLLQLARETQCHILMVHHMGKSDRDGGDGILGSTALFGSVDTALMMRKREESRTIDSSQRYGEDIPRTALAFDKETGTVRAAGTVEELEMGRIGLAILEVLGDEEMTEKEIRGAIGGNTGLVGKALRCLIEEERVTREGAGRKNDAFRYRKILVSSLPSIEKIEKREKRETPPVGTKGWETDL